MENWSNLSKIVYKRTYARKHDGKLENWTDTINRVINGNLRLVDNKFIGRNEKERLFYFLSNRKATPAGRGLWFSGVSAFEEYGGKALNNCWFLTADDWKNFVTAYDLLMLGGGVGMSVEHKFVSKLPRVKKNVQIEHIFQKDTDYIVPDSRQGFEEILSRALFSYFIDGKSFTYSTVCVRPEGEPIKGFGGRAAGPKPLISMIKNISNLLDTRSGKHIRPIDAADLLCIIGAMVVAGNVRRSALLIQGDCWDKEYLKSKRWDIGVIPSYRAMANFSVVCDDIEDLHPSFWKTFEHGEAIGIINTKNIKKFGRINEIKNDTAIGVNPCGEATLESHEPCNLLEIFLPNLASEKEFVEAAKLMLRYGKRVTLADYKDDKINSVVRKNRRIGIGITGCLQSNLFKPEILDRVYKELLKEDKEYSKKLGINESIRMTVVKPSGTLSLIVECTAGIHPAHSRYMIRRVRFSASDSLIPLLEEANHKIEPVKNLDGTIDSKTLVVDFYLKYPENTPSINDGFGLFKQLNSIKIAQEHWADQSVSCTAKYQKDQIPEIKSWLEENLSKLKTISFMQYSNHGFKQAPEEEISKEEFEKLSLKIKPICFEDVENGPEIKDVECLGGSCPVK